MTVAATAKRRRKQAVMGYRHMAHMGRGNNNRPYYSKHTAETLDARLAARIEKEKLMQVRKARAKSRGL